MPHAPSRLHPVRSVLLALAIASALVLAACSDTRSYAPMPEEGQLDRLAVNVGPTEQLIAVLEQRLADGATPPGPYQSMINQLQTALRLAEVGRLDEAERLVMRVGERIEGMVERGQLDPDLANTLLDTIDAIVSDDACTPTTLTGDAVVTDGTVSYWTTSPFTHVTGSVLIDGLSVSDVDVLPCLERVDGNVVVVRNGALAFLHAFDRLANVGGRLQFFGNPALTAVPTFPALLTAGDVVVLAWPVLDRIEGFNALTTIDGLLRIDVEVTGDTTTLDGFYALTTIRFPPFVGPTVTVLCPSFSAIESAIFAGVPCVDPE